MALEYMPVLKARQGEFDALSKLKNSTFGRVEPVLELPTLSEYKIRTTKCLRESSEPIALHLNKAAEKIAMLPHQLTYYVDMRGWAPNAVVESGEHILSFVCRRLRDLGAKTCPVVSYDLWADPEYKNALRSLPLTPESPVVIRLEADALEDMDDPDYFLENLSEMLSALSLSPDRCTAMLDFGDVTNVPVIDIQSKLEAGVSLLSGFYFRNISIAASSISALIGDMVSEKNSTAIVMRREINAWKVVKTLYPRGNLIFGDYGVRNPNSLEDGPYPDVNGKIRYTFEGGFFVLRGHSMRQFSKGAQYDVLAQALVESPYYMGEEFSWGDRCASVCPARSPGKWVGFDTNHHIEAVVMEIIEFKQSSAFQKAYRMGL
ncbi:hypothetical protein BZY95_06350 [Billgrantia desiderata SP1]|uniref:beta family protein n=1 Tax=Billgrantia desiderata TaxID=52021 RepID=UPI000A380E51|nr:beta family protein [Halomonas desiderata]OUE44477.1 hypothetical protein BZY95_06350 [Halomonas desiderata SP1]